MIKKLSFTFFICMFLVITGCIKDTYNMNKLSDKAQYSPTLAVAAVTGDITLSDIVKSNDTIIFDSDKFVRLVLKKDSVIDFKLKDYYDLSNMVSFSKGYKCGDLKLDDFQSSMSISLNTISQSFTTPGLRAAFLALNGTTDTFPSFPKTDLGKLSFTAFNNFQNAVFSSGTMTISIKNSLPAPLDSIKISLFNSSDLLHPIGSQLTIPPVAAGATKSATLDLAGKTMTNSIVAAIVLNGSPGTKPTKVLIDLNSTIQVSLSATNLKVQSGRIILPPQAITSLSGVDIVSFNPGNNVEIERLKVTTGNIGYTLVSSSSISGSFAFTLPTTPVVTKTILINGSTNTTGSIPINNTDIDLSTDATQNFNRIPVNYSVNVNSNGNLINFNKNDSIHININMLNPVLDYAKGYFGQLSEQVNPDILNPGIDELLNHITGSFYISNPSITLNYSNSFGIPVEVTLNATGKRNTRTVNLGLSPFTIAYPTTLITRDVTSSFAINKTNSKIDSLVSLPPSEITFSGSAKMNPAGVPPGGRNNYVFGNSRFLGSVEVEVPLTLRIQALKFSDTLDNFLQTKDNNNTSFKPEDTDSLRINIVANNGFPLAVSLKMILYDSLKKSEVKTIDASNLLNAAPVDANGKVTGKTESTTTIKINKDFFSAVDSADKIIFLFTLNTSGNGSKDVKIYSDYSISFKASVVVKPKLNL